MKLKNLIMFIIFTSVPFTSIAKDIPEEDTKLKTVHCDITIRKNRSNQRTSFTGIVTNRIMFPFSDTVVDVQKFLYTYGGKDIYLNFHVVVVLEPSTEPGTYSFFSNISNADDDRSILQNLSFVDDSKRFITSSTSSVQLSESIKVDGVSLECNISETHNLL